METCENLLLLYAFIMHIFSDGDTISENYDLLIQQSKLKSLEHLKVLHLLVPNRMLESAHNMSYWNAVISISGNHCIYLNAKY